MPKIGINSWVRPESPGEHEFIVGRVVHIPAGERTDIRVAWLSNERGLWLNYEAVSDLVEVHVPEIGWIEAIMTSATHTTPQGYEA